MRRNPEALTSLDTFLEEEGIKEEVTEKALARIARMEKKERNMTRDRGTQAPPLKEKPEPINNTELVTKFRNEGGGILHIRPQRFFSLKGKRVVTKGVTVAFKMKGTRIELATALQHSADCFSKKVGTKTAIEHFEAGKTVSLPLRSKTPVASLKRAVTGLV